jgi:hypothetical protein
VTLATRVLCACLAAAPAAAGAVPLWSVHGEHGTVWLLGSVHVLRRADYPLPGAVQRVYATAERIVMELDLDDLDPMEMQSEMVRRGLPGDGPAVRKLLGDADWERARAEAATLGLDIAPLGGAEAWLAALVTYNLALARSGYDPALGVDQHLAARAASDGKPVEGLETLTEQLELFDGLSANLQRAMFDRSIEELPQVAADAAGLVAAWRAGDVERLEQRLEEDFEGFEVLRRPLVLDRNRRWVAPVAALLDAEGDSLVVVGALHLVGEAGLPALLQARGYEVRMERGAGGEAD